MDNNYKLYMVNPCQLSSVHNNRRSIATLVSHKNELVEGLENNISAFEGQTLSTNEKYSMFIEKLIISRHLEEAVDLFFHLHDRHIHMELDTYNILLNATSEASSFNHFTNIFKRLLLSELQPDFTSYVCVAKAFQNDLESTILLKFIRDILEITVSQKPIVMNRIIFVTAKSGQLEKGLLIFEELKNTKANLDTVTFNTVLVILGRAGKVDQMLNEFNLMKDFGHSPNIITYNTLINCMRRLGRLEMCKFFAKEMVERGIMLDPRTYTALIDGLGRAGHIDDAIALFNEMKKLHCPSIYNYRAMISNLKKAGKNESAMKLLEEMNSGNLKLIGPEDFKLNKKRRYNRN